MGMGTSCGAGREKGATLRDRSGMVCGHSRPDEVVHGHGDVVRIVAVEVLAAARLAGRVPDGVNLEVRSFGRHRAPDGTVLVPARTGRDVSPLHGASPGLR